MAKGTSYVLNEYIAVPLTNSFGEVRESLTNRLRLDRPAQTILLFIGADSLDIGVSADHTHSRNWRDWPRVLHDIQPDRHRAGAASEDHTRGSANYLFGDGHVEGIEAAVVKRRIDNLEPFARPPE